MKCNKKNSLIDTKSIKARPFKYTFLWPQLKIHELLLYKAHDVHIKMSMKNILNMIFYTSVSSGDDRFHLISQGTKISVHFIARFRSLGERPELVEPLQHFLEGGSVFRFEIPS